MACGMYYLKYLAEKGIFLDGAARVFDVGSQNLLVASVDEITEFVLAHHPNVDNKQLESIARKLSERSVVGHNDTTLYLGEVLDLTGIDYVSIDICQGHKTRIFDLNFQSTPAEYSEAFDVVLNFGTTEHVFNQYNSFKIMHETAKRGAYFFHQVPSIGYIDHGYFMYSPRTFVELAEANGYALLDLWFTGPQGAAKLFDVVSYRPDISSPARQDSRAEDWGNAPIPNAVVNVLLRKERSGPFRLSVDATTSAGVVVDEVSKRYGTSADVAEDVSPGLKSPYEVQQDLMNQFPARALARELWKRIKRKARAKLA